MDETFTLLRRYIDATYVKVSAQNTAYSSRRSARWFSSTSCDVQGPPIYSGKKHFWGRVNPPYTDMLRFRFRFRGTIRIGLT